MTTGLSKTLAIQNLASTIRVLALALGWLRLITAFQQKSAIPADDPSSAGHVPLPYRRQRGRPPSIAAFLLRAHAAYLESTRPAYAKERLHKPSNLMTALLNEGAFAAVRKSYGLHHKSFPDSLALDMLSLDDASDECFEAGVQVSPVYLELQAKVLSEWMARNTAISKNAKDSGQKVREVTQRTQIEAVAPHLLLDLVEKRITPETMQTRLRKLQVSFPIPSVRSLRRMAQQKRGQEPTRK